MNTAHVAVTAVWSNGKLRLDEPAYLRQLAKMKLGEGEEVEIRIERAIEAKKHWQLKWYYGYIVKQVVEHTGYTVLEIDAMFRALYLPPDVATLSLMTYEQMREFNLACEQYAAEVIGVAITGPDDIRKKAA